MFVSSNAKNYIVCLVSAAVLAQIESLIRYGRIYYKYFQRIDRNVCPGILFCLLKKMLLDDECTMCEKSVHCFVRCL